MLSFYLAIPVYLPKCYESGISRWAFSEVRFGLDRSVDWAGYGSVRFSHSFCLFWLLCLKSILPKCGWINFMLFDSLLNTKKQQITKKRKQQQQQIYGQQITATKAAAKNVVVNEWSCCWLWIGEREWMKSLYRTYSVCLVPLFQLKLNQAGQERAKNKGLLTLKTGKWSFVKLKCEYRVTWRAS